MNTESSHGIALDIGSYLDKVEKILMSLSYDSHVYNDASFSKKLSVANALLNSVSLEIEGLNESAIEKRVKTLSLEMTRLYRVQQSQRNNTETTKAAVQADIDVQALRLEVETLKEIVARAPSTPVQSGQIDELQVSLKSMESRLTSLDQTIPELTAPIIVPPRDKMTQRLFSGQDLMRLEESRSDEQWIIGFAGLLLGAILGIFINYATIDSTEPIFLSRTAGLLLIVLGLVFVSVAIWWFRIHIRVQEAKKDVFGSEKTL